MSLFDYSAENISDDIRAVMRHAGYAEDSVSACKAWARAFIVRYVHHWRPGIPLTTAETQRVGAAFEAALEQARQRKREWPKFVARSAVDSD